MRADSTCPSTLATLLCALLLVSLVTSVFAFTLAEERLSPRNAAPPLPRASTDIPLSKRFQACKECKNAETGLACDPTASGSLQHVQGNYYADTKDTTKLRYSATVQFVDSGKQIEVLLANHAYAQTDPSQRQMYQLAVGTATGVVVHSYYLYRYESCVATLPAPKQHDMQYFSALVGGQS